MMVLAHGVVRDSRSDKITGYDFCPLMDELVEGVLSVRTRFSPNHGPGLITDFATIPINIFSVAFHIALLKICGEPVHVLIVGQYGLGLGAKKIIVPDSDHGENDRYVRFIRRLPEMDVHGIGALQKLREIFKSYCA